MNVIIEIIISQTQLFCLAYSLSSLVTVEEEGNSEVQQHPSKQSYLDFFLPFGSPANLHLEVQGASIDLPYSYSLLPAEPSHALITILGIMLILPFIHLFFVFLYKLRCSLVKVIWSTF